jgi:hypothetical protein
METFEENQRCEVDTTHGIIVDPAQQSGPPSAFDLWNRYMLPRPLG